MHGNWIMQKLIKSCVWHDLFKANFVSHTFSMWLETHRHLFPKIKWLIARTRSTAISILSELNYVSFSLSLTLCLYTKIFFFRRKFLFKKQFLWMRSYEYIYIYIYTHTLVNRHIWKKKKLCTNLLTQKKKKNWTRGIIHTCLSPTQCLAHEHINSYVIFFLSFVGLNDFYYFKSIFKWTYYELIPYSLLYIFLRGESNSVLFFGGPKNEIITQKDGI